MGHMNSAIHGTAYAELLEETPALARARERAALERAIELLQIAEAKGPRSHEEVEALQYLNRLWAILIEDLANPDNDLPRTLRANLISIGIWVLREADRIRAEEAGSYSSIIEVMGSIAKGLS